ncbi:MAG: ATP synthase subunit delta [Planctomycetaceae bacterium]|nr:MAG: ATP synthase subunit delta [Planctomycetaceae bacterium]
MAAAKHATVLDDPRQASVARVYAEALLRAAGDQQEALLEEYQSFLDDVLAPQPAYERLLCSPATPLSARLQLLDRVLAQRATPTFLNFLRVLARHHRLGLVRIIASQMREAWERQQGLRRVQVITAYPMSDATRQDLQRRVAELIAARPILEVQVDPTLLGGVILRIGDTVYDGSIRHRLKLLRAKLRERCMHEIQRGRDRFSYPEGN